MFLGIFSFRLLSYQPLAVTGDLQDASPKAQ